MTTAPKTKTPTVTVDGTTALIRANGHPGAKELINELPGRRWAAKRNAWAITARFSEELTELIAKTGATVADPEGRLTPGYVAPAPANPAPYYFGVRSATAHEAWEVGQVMRVSIKNAVGTPGIAKDRGIVKVDPEGNAWIVVVTLSLEHTEHLGREEWLSTGTGRPATEDEIATGAVAPVEALEPAAAPVEDAEPTAAPVEDAEPTPAPVEAPEAVEAPAVVLEPAEALVEAPAPTNQATIVVDGTEAIIKMDFDGHAVALVKQIKGRQWNKHDSTWRIPVKPSAALNAFARQTSAKVVDLHNELQVSLDEPALLVEAPRGPYSFGNENPHRFPKWSIGTLVQTTAPALEPREGPLVQTPIDLRMPGSTWLCIVTLYQEKTESFSGSKTPWDFLSFGTARPATEDEVEAHLKKNPKLAK
jgi:hypothetical protein